MSNSAFTKNSNLKLMVKALLILVFGIAFLPKAFAHKLATNGASGCVLFNEGVRCWGWNFKNPETLGIKFNKPTQIAIGGDSQACVLDVDGLKCWRRDVAIPSQNLENIKNIFSGELISAVDQDTVYVLTGYPHPPTFEALRGGLKNPTSASFDREKGCVVDEVGLSCFDKKENIEETFTRQFKNGFGHVSAATGRYTFNVCAQDQRGGQCNNGLTVPLEINNKNLGPISVGYNHACAIYKNEIHCWGWGPGAQVPKGIKNPKEIHVAGGNSCVLDDEGVKCWGTEWPLETWTLSLNSPKSLSSNGSTRICVNQDSGVSCRGFEDDRSSFNREFLTGEQVKNFVVADEFYCWTTNKGTQCDGVKYGAGPQLSDGGRTQVHPNVKQPSLISLGHFHACAVEKNKAYCWGKNSNGQTNVPKSLKNVSDLSSGLDHVCAIGDKKIACWGSNTYQQTEYPSDIQDPIFIRSHRNRSCVIDGKAMRVRCWGNNKTDTDKNHPVLKNPRELYIGIGYDSGQYQCVIDDEGIKCWGEARIAEWASRMNRHLKHPVQMVASRYFTCVLDQTPTPVVRCFDSVDATSKYALGLLDFQSESEPIWNWQRLGESQFNLNSLEDRLAAFSLKTPPLQSWMLKELSTFTKNRLENCFHSDYAMQSRPECASSFNDAHGHSVLASRYLLLKMLFPLLESLRTEEFKNSITPNYEKALTTSEAFFQKNGIYFGTLTPSRLEKSTVLKLLELSLRASIKVIGANRSSEVMTLVKLVAKAHIHPDDHSAIQALLEQYQIQTQKALAPLSDTPKAGFLLGIIESCISWLKRI